MPTVPKPQRQVELQPLAGVRLTAAETPESQGLGLAEAQGEQGQALAGVGAKTAAIGEEAYGEVVRKEKQRGDNIATLAADTQLGQWINKRVYDPQTGALTVKGKDALGLPEQLRDEYNQQADTIAASLTTPEQQQAFRRIRAERGLELDATMSRHTFAEVQQYQAQELEASLKNSRSYAIANASDPRAVGLELQRQREAIATHAKDLGFGPEQIQQQTEASISATHVGVIEQLLAQEKPTAAQIYFEEANTKGEISGEAIARIEKALHEGSTRKEGQQKADAILAVGGTLSEQREKARAIEDPDVRDNVTQRLEHEWSVREQIQRQDSENAMTAAVNILDQTPDVNKIPPTAWRSFTESQRSALRSYAEHLARGDAVETNFATYDVLERLGSSRDVDERQKFADMNLLQFAGQLSKTDMKHFLDVQGAIRRSDPDKHAALTANDSVIRQIVDGNLVALGLNPNPAAPGKNDYDKTTSDRVLAYRRAVRDAVAAREAVTKKKLTEPEVQDLADTLIAQTVAEQWHLLRSNEPARYAFETPELGVSRAVDVPASERTQIEAALKRAGLPVTDTAVVNLFNQHLQLVRGKGAR